jgi:Protein of unknown function (DUF2924)
MPRNMREGIEIEIARLRGLDLDGLRSAWRAMFGKPAAAHLPKYLLMRILAYRLQAEAFGDLPRSAVLRLDSIASSGDGKVAPVTVAGALRPGTVLIREHERQRHHVMVVEKGFAWNGATYPSLSKVAHAITGTRWNGPRFFGLREKAP